MHEEDRHADLEPLRVVAAERRPGRRRRRRSRRASPSTRDRGDRAQGIDQRDSGRRRSASPSILSADGVGRARAFTLRLAAIAAAGVALRALYLFTVGRHVTGIGDWCFYHWQANLIADGQGFVEPYRCLLRAHALAVGRAPAAVSAGCSRRSRGSAAPATMAHRALGLLLGAVTIVARRAARPPRGRRARRPGRGRAVRGLPADDRRRRRADERDALRPADRPRAAGRLAVLDARRPWAAALLGAAIGARGADALGGAAARAVAGLAGRRGAAGRGWPAAVAALATAAASWSSRRGRSATRSRSAPRADLDQRLDRDRRRELPAHLPRRRLGGWNISCISPRRHDNEAAPGRGLAPRGPRLRARPRRRGCRVVGRRGCCASGTSGSRGGR